MARKNCLICNKGFYAKPRDILRGYAKFCSKSCYDKWQKDSGYHLGNKSPRWNSIKRICRVCSKEFYESPSRIADGRGIYCSKECYSKGMVGLGMGRKLSDETRIKIGEQRIGKLNPAYIDGRSRDFKRYKGQFSNLIKQKIREKYNSTCQNCKTKKGILHVHHIDLNPLNNNLDNLILFCISCHRRVHIKYSNIMP